MQAAVEEARGGYDEAAADFAAAAVGWREFSMPYEEAQASLGRGRSLLALRRGPEAVPALERARDIFVRLGAVPALTETDELLQQVASA